MKYDERLKASDYLLLLLIVIAFAAVSWIYQINQFFNYDQTQMLLKGYYAAFTGTYLPFGNEASTMGNLPGMVSSWVIGFPLQLYMHPYAPAIFQTIVRILGILIFANALSLLFSRRLVLLGTFLFALSPWTMYQTMLYNPAYLTFCAPLVLNCLIRLRYDHNDRHQHHNDMPMRMAASFLLVIAIGLIIQLHFSWPVLVAGAGILWLRRDIKVNYIGIGLGFVVLGLSLWPYVQEVLHNPNLFNNPEAYAQDRYFGYGLVHVYPILKGILYWLRFASFSVTKKAIVPEIEDDYSMIIVILCWTWIIVTQAFGVLSVIVSAYANYFTLGRVKGGTDVSKNRFIRGLTISFILAVAIAAAASPLVLSFWQIAVVMPFALIPLLNWLSVKHNYIKLYFICALVFFVFANASGSLRSDKFDYSYSFDEGLYRTCLFGFSPEKCSIFGIYLDESQKATIQSKFRFDQGVYDRVIRGLIPLPDGSLKPLKEFTIPFLSSGNAPASMQNSSATTDAESTKATAAQEVAQNVADAAPDSEATDAKTNANGKTEPNADAKAADSADGKNYAEADAKNGKRADANDGEAKADIKRDDAADAKADAKEADLKGAEDKKVALYDSDAGETTKDAATSENGADGKDMVAEDTNSEATLSEEEMLKLFVLDEGSLLKAFPSIATKVQNKLLGIEEEIADNNAEPKAAGAGANGSTGGATATGVVAGGATATGAGAAAGVSGSIVVPAQVKQDNKKENTGVIVDAGSGDSGELIIN